MSDDIAFAGMSDANDGDFSIARMSEQPSALNDLARLELRGVHVVRQVHGTEVVRVDDSGPGIHVHGEADGLIADARNTAIGVRVADCVPVFLVCAEPRVGGVVHAGREGTRTGIADAAVGRLSTEFGIDASDLRALIGPSAGPCCYEVDTETAEQCSESGMSVIGRNIDLWDSNRRQLIAAGVDAKAIDVAGICTICSERFHSYRRTGTPERNLAVLVL